MIDSKSTNSYVYDLDSIIQRGEELDTKRQNSKSAKIEIPVQNINSIFRYNSEGNYEEKNKINLLGIDLDKLKTIKSSINYFGYPTNFDYSITNNCKTITKIKGESHQKMGFACLIKVPYSEIVEFSFNVEKSNDKTLFIGFMEEGTNLDNGASATSTSWLCYLNDGRFLNAGGKGKENFYDNVFTKPENDNFIITLCIDTSDDLMYLKYNGVESNKKLKMNIEESQKNRLIPCVDIRKVGDKITIY